MGSADMTAIGPAKPEPLLEKLTQRPPTVRRSEPSRERSLADILSLTDARRFVPESLGLLLLIGLMQIWLTHGVVGPSSMPHPFWIPVLLMSGQYGIMGG